MKDNKKSQICTRCVMDTTDTEIVFDEKGVCNHCKNAIKNLKKYQFPDKESRKAKLYKMVDEIKRKGHGKIYNCVIGLSGGVDSSYLAYIVKELGLNPLAIHVDNGWDSELAVNNIENLVKKLDIDLYTYVLDWEEFKDLQNAFLKASVVDLEMLSDNAIVIGVYRIAKKYRIKYYIDGTNLASESIMPRTWFYIPKYDSLNIKSIYKKYGNGLKLNTYPLLSFYEYVKYRYFKKGNSIPLLNYIPYEKKNALEILQSQFGWRDYGGKHYESKITQFYQAYILPTKFNIDKRKAHLSSLICSNQITRNEALNELQKELYDPIKLREDKEYFIKKIGLSVNDFEKIMMAPPVSHYFFPAYDKYHKRLSSFKNKRW